MSSSQRSFFWLSVSKGRLSLYLFIPASTLFWTHTAICSNLIYLAVSYNLPVVVFHVLNRVWLCDPMDCSMPSFPVLHYLPEFAQTHVHWVKDIDPTISSHVYPFLLLTSVFPGIRVFSNELSLGIWCQSIGASASVLPMSIKGWFPLGLTGFISLLSKGLLRVSSSTTIWKHQLFSVQSSLVQFSHLYVTTGKTTALTIQNIVSKVLISLRIFVTFCILNAQEVTDMSKKYSICWMNKWVNKL